jgi:hypothetical protein
VEVERRDDVIARDWRLNDALGSLVTFAVKSDFEFSVSPGEHAVEGLLQSLAPLGFRPKHLAVLDDPISIATRPAGIANDCARDALVRIETQVNRLERELRTCAISKGRNPRL